MKQNKPSNIKSSSLPDTNVLSLTALHTSADGIVEGNKLDQNANFSTQVDAASHTLEVPHREKRTPERSNLKTGQACITITPQNLQSDTKFKREFAGITYKQKVIEPL